MARRAHRPRTTKSGLVHVQSLISRDEYDALVRKRGPNVSLGIRAAVAADLGLPAPAAAGRYQADHGRKA